MKKFNEKSFIEDLERNFAKSNINELIKGKLANEATSEFTKIFTDTLDFHAPFIEILPKEKNVYIPWYNDELRTKIKIKKEILKDSRTLGKDLFKERLKKITNTINFLKKFLKQKYILDELEKAGEDPKKLWKVLNFLLGKREAPEKIEPEEINQEKVNKFNNFFATIGQKIQDQLQIDFNYRKENNFDFPAFEFENESEISIEKIIESIKTDWQQALTISPQKLSNKQNL